MKYDVVLSDEARLNLQETSDYYLLISTSLNQRFEEDLDSCIASLKKDPFLYQERYRNIRVAYLDNFPFGIHFIITENTIHILKILHTKRLYQ